MTLSPDERRNLGKIGRALSRDRELLAVANLFAQPPAPPQRVQLRVRRRGYPGTIVAVLVAVLAFIAGCLVASVNGPWSVTAGTLLVLCSAMILTAVLCCYRRRLRPGRTGD
jgi:DUF3040 family protein